MEKGNINFDVALVGVGNAPLQLSPITLKEEYRKKWNVHENDFVALTRNGELVSNSLYRVGGFGGRSDVNKGGYFMLLKHVEAYYADNITKEKARKPHLESRWVIIDNNGVEKVEFNQFKTPYLTKDSLIYHVDNRYYNIETGEQYGDSIYTKVESKEFLFLENLYDKDDSKRGVMKINKKDGTWELFPIK